MVSTFLLRGSRTRTVGAGEIALDGRVGVGPD